MRFTKIGIKEIYFRNLPFKMSANTVLSPVFLSRLSPDSNFRESDYMLQRSFELLDAYFFSFLCNPSNVFLFICLIIIMSNYLIFSNLLSFNVHLTPNLWLEHASQGLYAITLSFVKMKLSLCSFNVRDLGQKIKGEQIFTHLYTKQFNVCFLQETLQQRMLKQPGLQRAHISSISVVEAVVVVVLVFV